MKNAAIVLAGGSGSRMHSRTKKQYMLIGEKPVLYYSLYAFQEDENIDEIVLVCGENEIDRCRHEIVERFGFTKVTRIVPGGKERHDSVYAGLQALAPCNFVLIHDGARPFIDRPILERVWLGLQDARACTVGMPVKDTIKLSNDDGCVEKTLPRERLWMIQTPQAFDYEIICRAHEQRRNGELGGAKITDDAMLVEYTQKTPVKLIEGSYANIKITTPDDLLLAEVLLAQKNKKS